MKLAESASLAERTPQQMQFVGQCRHPRVFGHALSVSIEGRSYQTLDWSLSGFRVNDFHRVLAPCQQISGLVVGRSGIRDGEFTAEIVEAGTASGIVCRWLDISADTLASMAIVKAN